MGVAHWLSSAQLKGHVSTKDTRPAVPGQPLLGGGALSRVGAEEKAQQKGPRHLLLPLHSQLTPTIPNPDPQLRRNPCGRQYSFSPDDTNCREALPTKQECSSWRHSLKLCSAPSWLFLDTPALLASPTPTPAEGRHHRCVGPTRQTPPSLLPVLILSETKLVFTAAKLFGSPSFFSLLSFQVSF